MNKQGNEYADAVTQEQATEDRNKIIHTIMDEIESGNLNEAAPNVVDITDPYEILDDSLSFLDLLRSEGTVNMFGARPELEEYSELGKNLTRMIHVYWMKTFGVVALVR